ncbi:LysR family transcriptional regulator [Rhizobium ruizarguesonis]|uniref:LysR family transcriptional regulator n=1 Tax=Rhizobium ruizarguesonis TaxID=2081791 RepID=UPI0010321707|nr:LysR family transcriptional regulator [Rhizobium ruizarguesonis]NKL10855.1 LysR family transcriptional regulator [Rhizobium leguminosarum bv. viciae]NEJ01286.1 LysR family transcriptional regulator [Rhizobium ruizarguesonis]NEJ34932.1 LysR family transcriptional regulator [Rhizobium ruizarguesonis]TAT93014.1 LysR family transcriptional regulator [Rhizobium ruizarguesonis]TAZ05011.1 LysR family transcriptional regulator [Rhizobium ruizarguesonis]
MELRQLSMFKAVAEELHFGRAAAKMSIAQPALSNHVMALEKELGCPLFIRSTRRVELTRAGATFYDRAVRILSDIELTAELTRAVGGSRIRQIKIGTVYPATMGVLPVFLGKIARKFPDVRIHIASGNTSDIIRGLETGRLNLGFIRPVENIGPLRFFSVAHERYLLAVAVSNPLAAREEISIEDLRDQKIIAFNRQNLSFTERYFNEKFEQHGLTKNIAYSCDDTYSLVSLVSAGLGTGFAPEWTMDIPNRTFVLKKVRGIEFKIGLGIAWSKEDPTASRDDIVDIAKSLARRGQ